jgi:predicted AAA+ superfamily ATPase
MFSGGTKIAGTCPLRLEDYTDLILGSGFPGLQHLSGAALTAQLDGYIERIVDRDMPEAGLRVRRPATLKAWLRAYGAAVATPTSWEKIRDAASPGHGDKPAKTTTLPFIDTLTQLRILDDLPAWIPSRNHLNRLTEAPKHHLADPALAARLAGITRASLLQGSGNVFTPNDGTYLGQLFESLATMSVRVFAGPVGADVSHLRLGSGRREVDMVVERGEDRSVVAFEVKLAASVSDNDVKHLVWLREQLGDQLVDAAVLTTGEYAYRRPDGVAVIPLGLLGP